MNNLYYYVHNINEMEPFTDKFESVVIDDFATNEECDELKKIADESRKVRATVGSERKTDNKVRNNTTSFVKVQQPLREKINKLLRSRGVDVDVYEDVQVQIYEPQEHYNAHTDSWVNTEVCKKDATVQQRSWTCVLYLNDVEEGGGTYFTKADARIMPKKGRVACWDNLDSKGHANMLTEHMGEDVIKGRKYLANFWYNTKANCEESQNSVASASSSSSWFSFEWCCICFLIILPIIAFIGIVSRG